MSTIEAIVKAEADAAAMLASATADAERIKAEGQAAAAAIRAASQAQKSADETTVRAAADQHIQASDDGVHAELQQRLAARQRLFDQQAAAAAAWVVDSLLASNQDRTAPGV